MPYVLAFSIATKSVSCYARPERYVRVNQTVAPGWSRESPTPQPLARPPMRMTGPRVLHRKAHRSMLFHLEPYDKKNESMMARLRMWAGGAISMENLSRILRVRYALEGQLSASVSFPRDMGLVTRCCEA